MSHFSLLVIGKNVEEQLAPYHEFECTGNDDKYVVDVDRTEDARKKYEERTETRYKDPEGNLHDPYTADGNYDPRYWRVPTKEELDEIGPLGGMVFSGKIIHAAKDWNDGRGYSTRVFQLPEGWTEVEIPQKEAESFAEFCESYYGHKIVPFGHRIDPKRDEEYKYGYTLVDEKGEVIKTVDRTNPNKKWDWYSIGGRWTGFFKLKEGKVGALGRPGLQSTDPGYKPPTRDRADVLLKKDIDIDGMRNEAAIEAEKTYDKVFAVIGHLEKALSWEKIQELNKKEDGQVDWEKARVQYREQPAVKALKNAEDKDLIWVDAEDFSCTRDEYVQRARNRAIATFAILKDGVWYERGKMGWWACVSDEKDENEWINQFSKLIDELPDDTMMTVVDCHI